MKHIRTAEDLACALDSPLHPELRQLIASHADRLAEYPDFSFKEMAEIVVVEAGETLHGICSVTGPAILTAGAVSLTFPVEMIVRHSHWIERTSVLDDFGFGCVLLIEIAPTSDTDLLAICERELQHQDHSASSPLE